MKKITLTLITIMSLGFMGCQKQNSSNGNVNASANSTTTNGACPAGYWYSNGQCYGSNNTIMPANYNFSNGFYADNYSGTSTITVTNTTKMKEFFKLGMGVCDRAANNYGQANCDYYVQGQMDIILQFPSYMNGYAVATIIARPASNPYYNYQAQFPNGWGLLGIAVGYFTGVYIPDTTYYTGAYRDPLQLQMAVSPINNNAGFQATGYGDYWTGLNQTLISIKVDNGNVNSTNFNYKFMVSGQEAAKGSMVRCQTMNCGL
jgi:hypothetical protein